ncbi:cytochrome P450 [Bradyrhizobium sp. KBS0727]|uniref:cytochrome P450 n=1 Tax=unclassified Bradyrhizobium TaxID=2631580 RepID=UPI00110EB14E|nr:MULTISPECIES: cytochrome P450 [unclassified Bradyrhizobium]QDW40569.1 cytochrome P450 [Bradyrhizobium sp. KBS0725]QDW47174.1 cytochrome P450 [Bradyrhizobium sp. KBS0727]
MGYNLQLVAGSKDHSSAEYTFERGNHRGAPILTVDPFTKAIFDAPFDFHQGLRDAGPVVWLSSHNCWAVGRYQEVRAVFADWETFCSGRGVGHVDYAKEKPWRVPSLLLEGDPPVHTEVRTALNRVLSPAAVKKLRGRIAEIAEKKADDLLAMGSFDAVSDLAEDYPSTVMMEAIGLPSESKEFLLPFGELIFTSLGPDNELRRQAMSGAPPLSAWALEQVKRERLAPVGFGADIYAAVDRGELKPEHAPVLVRALLAAGLDTTVNAIAAAIACFAQYPEQWQRLRADRSLARPAFEETIRFYSPAQIFFRTTTRPVTIGDAQIGEGEKILMFLGAANHDPRHWDNPDRFDITRRVSGHVGFGNGIHMCVGQFLARIEGEEILTALAKRISSFKLAGQPTPRYNNGLRGFDTLPITITPDVG